MVEKTSRTSLSLPIGFVAIGLLFIPTNGNLNDHRNASGQSAFNQISTYKE